MDIFEMLVDLAGKEAVVKNEKGNVIGTEVIRHDY